MVGVFVYGFNILKTADGKYYTRGYTQEYWERYSRYFDKIYITGRVKETKKEIASGYNELFGDRIEVIELPYMNSSLLFIKNWGTVRKELFSLIKESDCVIARQPDLYSAIGIKICKMERKPYITEMVGCPWDSLWNYGNLTGKIAALFSMITTKNRIRRAPYVIYVTKYFLQKRYPTYGKSINCSNVTLGSLEKKVIESRIRKIGCANEKIIIGTAARLDVWYKGQQYVIQALGELKKQGIHNFEYQLVGDGDGEHLIAIAKKYHVLENVKILGALKHEKVFSWMDQLDFYIQPSRQEGLPRALIEAMSRGIPAAGAATGGIPELLDNQFIFSNSKNTVFEICNILKGLTPKVLEQQAKRNFEAAKEYELGILSKRREDFFRDFFKNYMLQ